MNSQLSFETAKPKVIYLDAVGTLFGIKGSVGEIYRAIAIKYGVQAEAAAIDRAFIDNFKQSPPLAFQEDRLEAIVRQEFIWWKNLAEATFTQIEVLDNFTDFNAFFDELYAHFATKKPWYIYSDVVPSLKKWRQQGIQLGVISNFDTRLNTVLKLFDLDLFFSSITVSSIVGSAKPDKKIFQAALAKHNINASQAYHIGDSFNADYQGAKNIGIKSFWLDRSQTSIENRERLPNLMSLG
ncbi:HAD-IA family hydrolase [Myxosarcina sp. GI1]|uniref:HAD-IA family hydrolase n=1 Tax=Myxosarcina sp. GI1 TaxID=1541065 RepID=UPI000561DD09|nr:HAD-IA family hydrolase [Myxosarcina sp. GI1]